MGSELPAELGVPTDGMVKPDEAQPNDSFTAVPDDQQDQKMRARCSEKFEDDYRKAGLNASDFPDKKDAYVKGCVEFLKHVGTKK